MTRRAGMKSSTSEIGVRDGGRSSILLKMKMAHDFDVLPKT